MSVQRSSVVWTNRRRALVMVCILVTGAAFTWWAAVRADHEMRSELLHKVRQVARGINIEHVLALLGMQADPHPSDTYNELKLQLVAARLRYPQCRFYLMGLEADGTISVFGHSEPEHSLYYISARQPSEKPLAHVHRIFDYDPATIEGWVPIPGEGWRHLWCS